MKRYISIISLLVVLAVIAGALLEYEGNLLWKAQQLNLFLYSSAFFEEQMVVPGGFLTWLSTFFMQFMYKPWLGVSLLCAWWWLLMWLTKRTFRIPTQWTGILLIPIALLLLTIVDTGYWLYVLKLQGHFFVATIGTTAVAALLWAYRCLPDKYYLRTVFIFVVAALGYPLMGIYGLAAALLMGIWSWRLKGRSIVDSVVAVLSVVAVPLFCYRYVYYQTNLANIYYAELPLYYVTESVQTYYIPFGLLALFFIVLTVVNFKPMKSGKATVPVLVQAALLIVTIAGVVHFWFKDENFHRELAMQHHIDQLDWESTLREATLQEDEPTRAIVMMRNLALARMGTQGNQMFLYKNGAKDYASPFGMRTMLIVGPLAYYHYGLLNYCARLSTEMGVEFGWRAEHLKTVAKCAILNGEQQHARKYLGILQQSLPFKEWATDAHRFIGDSTAIAKDPEMGFIARMMHYDDNLTSDQGLVERFLMNSLATSTYTGDPLFQEQTLLATLWTKNHHQFWVHLSDYVRLHPNDPLPRYYQEAALLYGNIEGRTDLDQLPFDKGIRDTFEHFMQAAAPYNNADVDVARQGLYPFFGQTYFYDYYMMDRLPEY